MENLFIKNSSQDQEVLATSKLFLDRIVAQIKSAYSNVEHCRTEDHKSSTSIHIGNKRNRACTHCFSVNSKGIITYRSHDLLFFKRDDKEHPDVERLLKKYPESERGNSSSKFTLKLNIESEVDFVKKVKDIVFMLERDGFVLKR
jgi:hypothetical protein